MVKTGCAHPKSTVEVTNKDLEKPPGLKGEPCATLASISFRRLRALAAGWNVGTYFQI
jgi:hypothetical protein